MITADFSKGRTAKNIILNETFTSWRSYYNMAILETPLSLTVGDTYKVKYDNKVVTATVKEIAEEGTIYIGNFLESGEPTGSDGFLIYTEFGFDETYIITDTDGEHSIMIYTEEIKDEIKGVINDVSH